jgi:nucleoside-diphosphate-sugar epimerase
MAKKKYLVTGGTGFIGSSLVVSLIKQGHSVRVFDNNTRGDMRRLEGFVDDIEFFEGDIRDESLVKKACIGIDSVCHLAYINGTEFFYQIPEVILEVAVKGIMNIIDGCIKNNVPELILASSSEVYQSASIVPTPEDVSLIVPDVGNPRYSYGGGKIISELLTLNYGRKYFERTMIFRPHNVYGPDMGWEHVIPQFILRMKSIIEEEVGNITFPIQGSGNETRAFIYIDDFTDALIKMVENGENLEVYNIGTNNEISVVDLARKVGHYFNVDIEIKPGDLAKGGTLRRCPDISKITNLGFTPTKSLKKGITTTADWYLKNSHVRQKV